MNPKKRLSDSSTMQDELRALRAEEPSQVALLRAVNAMQALPTSVRRVGRPWVWRTATLAFVGVAFAMFVVLRPQPASAAILRQIMDAIRSQKAHHVLTLRPDPNGKLTPALEMWSEGPKIKTIWFGSNDPGQTIGYDGHVMYLFSPRDGGFIDDCDMPGVPGETIESFLSIPNAHLLESRLDMRTEGRRADYYAIGFSGARKDLLGGLRMDLYVEPGTRLPFRRDVMGMNGVLIERQLTQYVSNLPDRVFDMPKYGNQPMCDYPAIRRQLRERLERQGQVLTVGGVTIRLLAVLVGKHSVMALWTGGAPGDWEDGAFLKVEGLKSVVQGGRPAKFTIPTANRFFKDDDPTIVNELPLRGDVGWFDDTSSLGTEFTIEFPVWVEDRARPYQIHNGRDRGYRTKVAGIAKARVMDAIRVDDPERALWPPAPYVRATATAPTK